MHPLRSSPAPLTLILLAFLSLPCTLAAQAGSGGGGSDQERLKVARRVVEASGAEDIILKNIEMTLPTQRAQNPNIPAEFWDRFADRARTDVGTMVDSLAPLYAKRFSKAELDQLLAFYQSPVGRRIAAEQLAIGQESQQVGVRWGARMGAAVAIDMANEGKTFKP